METVTQPRSRANSAYRYTWDDNGDVVQVERPPGSSGETSEQNSTESEPQQPPRSRRGRGRRTVQWPFQSIVSEVSRPTTPATLFRRATWQLPRRPGSSATNSPRDSTLIPDYVVNFLRGETPETVAQRKRNGGKLGARDVDIETPHRRYKSRAGVIEDLTGGRLTRMTEYTNVDELSQTSSTRTEERMMLPPSNEKPTRGWRRCSHGWRSGVLLNVMLAFVIFLVSIISMIIAALKGATVEETEIFTGSCTTATHMNWGLHGLIAALVVTNVAGACYVFQVLSSPTRGEVSAAHYVKKWLDVGVPSVRNFAHIDKSRVFLSLVLLMVAVATSVMYNSVIFTSQAGTSYNLVFVDQSFLAGSSFSNATANNNGGLSRSAILILQGLAVGDQLTNLTSAQCLSEFGGPFSTAFANVLLVTSKESADSSLIQTTTRGTTLKSYTTTTASQIALDGSIIDYCLAEPADASTQTCTVHVNGILLIAILVLSVVTLVATIMALRLPHFEPLVTLGDAITSFLRDPDPATRDQCMLTKQDIQHGRWGHGDAKTWLPTKDRRWFRSPSIPRWLFTLFWWVLLTGMAAGVLAFLVTCDPDHALSSFGVASPHASFLLPVGTISMPMVVAAVVASLPQILLAGLYFATNALLTTYYLSYESSLYAITGKDAMRPLRVSADPEGGQTTSLFLTLPRPISWILAFLFAAMSFVLSQSSFVVVLNVTTDSQLTGIGFSSTGLAILIALLFLLATLVTGIGFRKAPSTIMANGQSVGNPLVLEGGSCSAVISARCHRVSDETNVWVLPVSWGVVYEGTAGESLSHCTYSARPVGQMELSRYYA